LAGGFFSMELRDVQSSLSEFSWIKNTSVRRVWPHEVEIRIEAFEPIAVWGTRYLSAEGQVFDAKLADDAKQKLLVTSGPDAAAQLVAEQIPILRAWFSPAGWQIKAVMLSERYSWKVRLSNGLEIELGRADTPTALAERVARLVNSAGFIEKNLGDGGGYVDLRYPNGFAMRTDKLHRVAAASNTPNVNVSSKAHVKTGEKND
jgi:cell division protein FtsQ